MLWIVAILVTLSLPHGAIARSLDSEEPYEQCKRLLDDLGITSRPNCKIPGSGDFYGLGVRLGIYLTWISSWIANNFVAGEMAGSK